MKAETRTSTTARSSNLPSAFRQLGDSALASNLGFCRPLPRPPWKIHKFLGSKTGIRFDTKWHHNWPNQLFSARISIQIPVRVFLDFPRKMGFRISGTKKKNRWQITSVKKSKNDFSCFLTFLLSKYEKLKAHRCSEFFRCPPTSQNHPNMLRQ